MGKMPWGEIWNVFIKGEKFVIRNANQHAFPDLFLVLNVLFDCFSIRGLTTIVFTKPPTIVNSDRWGSKLSYMGGSRRLLLNEKFLHRIWGVLGRLDVVAVVDLDVQEMFADLITSLTSQNNIFNQNIWIWSWEKLQECNFYVFKYFTRCILSMWTTFYRRKEISIRTDF